LEQVKAGGSTKKIDPKPLSQANPNPLSQATHQSRSGLEPPQKRLKKDTENGNPQAAYMLFLFLTGEAGETTPEAIGWLQKAAEGGLPDTQYRLAMAYNSGDDVPQDDAEVARWMEKAAENGLKEAHFNMAILLRNGQGVPQDNTKAFGWVEKAADQGYLEAKCWRGRAT
jgi:TPR repeat protein